MPPTDAIRQGTHPPSALRPMTELAAGPVVARYGAVPAAPNALLLASWLVVVAMAIQASGYLPAAALTFALASAGLTALVCGLLLSRGQRYPGNARPWRAPVSLALLWLGALAIVAAIPLARIHDGLGYRLPATVEGETFELDGVVDGLPQRFDFGDRVTLRVDTCRRVSAASGSAGDGSGGVIPAGEGCAQLRRVALDWGLPSARQRAAIDDASAAARWPSPGERWWVRTTLRRPVARVNPDSFDVELRWLQQGIGAIGRVAERRPLATEAGAWLRFDNGLAMIEALRHRIRDALEAVHHDRLGSGPGAARTWPLLGIVTGLSIGDQGAIDGALWSLFSRTGVSHLVAISGAHVTLLALLVAAALRTALIRATRRWPRMLTRINRPQAVLMVATGAAFVYALLAGWGIPAQRTCWMLLCAALLNGTGRQAGVLGPVLLAAAIIVAVDPWAVSAAGFWLSFAAVAAILVCARAEPRALLAAELRPDRWSSWRWRISAQLRAETTSQWAATVSLVPLVALFFANLSVVGPLANVFAIPLIGLVVTPLSLLAALSAPVLPAVASPVLGFTLLLLQWWVEALSWLDGWPGASVTLPTPGPLTLVTGCLAAILLTLPLGRRVRLLGALGLLPLLLGPAREPPADVLWLTALDIGTGSSLLIESGSHRMLVDTGSGQAHGPGAAQRHLLPYLRGRGIVSIDTLVLTHLDAMHTGGAATVLKELKPRRLVTAFDPRFLALPDGLPADLEIIDCVAPGRFELGQATVRMLAPSSLPVDSHAARADDASCVLHVNGPAGRVLLASDLTPKGEARLLRQWPSAALAAEVVALPRQGSRTAATQAWLDNVSPRWAVVQVGYRNRHQHPHSDVVDRVVASGAGLLRTDHDGAIQIRMRAPDDITIGRARRDSPPYWRLKTGD